MKTPAKISILIFSLVVLIFNLLVTGLILGVFIANFNGFKLDQAQVARLMAAVFSASCLVGLSMFLTKFYRIWFPKKLNSICERKS